jgi:outer membrane protein assembly factor BamB
MSLMPRHLSILVLCLGPGPLAAEDWPCFRGPGGQGISSETGIPTRWSETDGVVWSAEIEGEGWSSPIVHGDLVVVTTAADGGTACRVVGLDRATGKVRWNREVFRQETRRKEQKNSYASPTPATDGSRIFAVFGDGGIVSLDRDGGIAWTNREIRFHSQHGLGASPLLHEDLVIMPFDGSSDGDDRKLGWQTPWDRSEIVALEKATGKIRWRGRRGLSRIAHTTPVLHRAAARLEIVSSAGDVIQGFDPEDGSLLWTVRSRGEGVVPTPVTGDGLIFAASGFEDPTIRAVRSGAKGESTATHLAWEEKKGVPMIPSMVHRSPHLFAITTNGVATCYDAATGRIAGQRRIGGNHSSSPVWCEGKLYFLAEDGETTIVEASPEMAEVARNKLPGRAQASLAISGGRIFLRTDRRLHALGKP